MIVTTKELRIQPGKIIDQVSHGQEITITYRGKALAKIVPIQPVSHSDQESSIFGLWKTHEAEDSVEDKIRALRKGRIF